MKIVDFQFALEILPILLKACVVTISATLIGFALAAFLGLLFALARRSKNRFVALVAAGWIEFIRSTPLLIQIYFIYFILPEYGIRFPALITGIIGLGIHYSAYTSEVYRAGIDDIEKGQWEAATALNFSPYDVFRRIIIPQAIPPVVPALGNYFVAMFKDTPILSAIAVVELMQRSKIIGSETFRYLEPVTLVGIFFLILSLAAAKLIRRVEWKLSMTYKILKQQREN